jgi:hypothetical protein
MKSKSKMIKSELKEHGTPKRFSEIKKAKTPVALAKVIVKQHAEGKSKCLKCGKKHKGKC